MTIPATWKVVRTPDDGALRPGVDAPAFPMGAATIAISDPPTFPEVWYLHIWACRERDDAAPDAWKAMRPYVTDAKDGIYADTVPPPQSIHAVFAAIAHSSSASSSGGLPAASASASGVSESLEDLLALCAHIDTRVRAGANPRKDVVTDAPAFATHVAELTADHVRYLADVNAGDGWVASVPGEKGRARSVPLLVLRNPTATHALHWAFTDRTTPGGTGYGLVFVERDGQMTIAGNPGAKLDLSWLATELLGLERSRRLPALAEPAEAEPAKPAPDTAATYDIEQWHRENAVIHPPSAGSVVPFGELYNALAVRLLLKRPVTTKQRLGLLGSALVLVLVGAAIIAFAFLRRL